ncbi:antitoxin [Corynebacterium uberis]|uniref:antitoxin n=1 Tax=Corynebacterium TaxID=1716 RepID=UPI001D0A9CFF|nr:MULTISPECIES: antitoxin [Corynebacterium]MCZ9308856.1 antitoxin [Corynebacterium sp. c6VSa_13]UDL74665.1 antitoxin [Corynebacterium uberis]UDL76501.1 antitoxin [Corynebacterium uberis]UDL78713.1 antitoxin [Corynebacterium uberis]UDL80992.1 antitoxin [Corynebacterium uberis]
MGLFDEAKKKAGEFLGSDAGERKSDEFLDKAADFAKSKLGEDKAGMIDKARDAADERIGGGDPEPQEEGEAPAEEAPEQ